MRRTLVVLACTGLLAGGGAGVASATVTARAWIGPYQDIAICTEARDGYREMGGLAGNCVFQDSPAFWPRGVGYYFPAQDIP